MHKNKSIIYWYNICGQVISKAVFTLKIHGVYIRHLFANLYDAVNKILFHTFWLDFPCTEPDDYTLNYIKGYIRLHNHLHHKIILHHKMHFKVIFLNNVD